MGRIERTLVKLNKIYEQQYFIKGINGTSSSLFRKKPLCPPDDRMNGIQIIMVVLALEKKKNGAVFFAEILCCNTRSRKGELHLIIHSSCISSILKTGYNKPLAMAKNRRRNIMSNYKSEFIYKFK